MTFEIALTGINAASTQLENISNNIANNTTAGYKRSRVEFADMYTAANAATVGQGVEVSQVRQEFTQGDMQNTGRTLDLGIQGSGFFSVNDGGTSIYSRAGAFGVDREGFLVDSQGRFLEGFGVTDDGTIQEVAQNIQIDYSDLSPNVTTTMDISANLNSDAEILPPFDIDDPGSYNYTTSTTVYDSLGGAQIANVYYRRDALNTWSAFSYVGGEPVSADPLVGDQITFTSTGELQDVNGDTSGRFNTASFTTTNGSDPMEITIDLGNSTQLENESSVNSIVQNGYSSGSLGSFDVDESGLFFGSFTNGQTRNMGQITLTNFPNENGLTQIGATSWTETFASGEPVTGVPGSASLGTLQSSSLESSNVDITQELVSIIGAQRSFQANAQMISTGDTITQTIINLRR